MPNILNCKKCLISLEYCIGCFAGAFTTLWKDSKRGTVIAINPFHCSLLQLALIVTSVLLY